MGRGKVACILTPSAAFNWLFLARKECFSYCLEPSRWRLFVLLPFTRGTRRNEQLSCDGATSSSASNFAQ